MSEKQRLLLVEDDPSFGSVLKDYLLINDFDVTHAIDGEDGLNKFKSKDKIFMTEKIEGKKLITNYYRGVDEKTYTISEEKE